MSENPGTPPIPERKCQAIKAALDSKLCAYVSSFSVRLLLYSYF